MNAYILIAVAIVIMMVPVGLLVYQWVSDHKDDLRDIYDVRQHAHKRDILLIDYYRKDDIFVRDHHRNWMSRRMTWVSRDVYPFDQGYYLATKWMDNLRYTGVSVYVKLHNFYLTDPSDPRTCERLGLAEPVRLTSSVMYNIYHSQNMKRVISGLTKINFAPIDVKSLGVLIPVLIGVVVGMLYFIGGF